MSMQTNDKLAQMVLPQAMRDEHIGQILLEAGKLTPEQIERILALQREQNLRFGEAAIQLGLIDKADVADVLMRQFNYTYLAQGEQKFAAGLVAAHDPYGYEAEHLRGLRSQLKLRWLNGRKVLTCLGIHEDDGCSYVASNLAMVFAQLGEQTLLIDANLREPAQHEIFKLGGRQGLSEVLSGRAHTLDIVRFRSIPTLAVLPAGAVPMNPAELLSGNNAFTKLLNKLSSQFDVIVIDTPPAAIASETLTIASRTGGALVVARANKTRVRDIAAVRDDLEAAGAAVAGVVFNRH